MRSSRSKVAIIGSGGHSRSVIPLVINNNLTIEGIYDNSFISGRPEAVMGLPLKGKIEDLPEKMSVILAVGSNSNRHGLYLRYKREIYIGALNHNTSYIEGSVKMGLGNLVFANVFLNSQVRIGDNNIINSGAIIEHECKIGSHSHLSIGSILGGRVSVGNLCFIGAGSVIKDQVDICDNVIIGAGSVVVKSISEPGTYFGNPLKKIR